MRVLFIGGTGNISAECARHLFETGHEVGVLTRGTSEIPPEYSALRGDRHDPEALASASRGFNPEAVINFLGYETADLQVDHSVFSGRIRHYILISSTTVHAKPSRLPITEDAPVGNAFWEYARKKAECEQWLIERWRAEGFPATVVRPSHTYSKRWIPNAVASSNHTFARRLVEGKPLFIHDDGQTPWTLTAASDFAVGLAGLLGRQEVCGEAFHITSDEVLTWNEIYREVAAALDVRDPQIVPIPTDFICSSAPSLNGTLKGDKAHPGVFDNSKIKRFVPGFACTKGFRRGIAESAAWLRSDESRWKLDRGTDEMIERVLGDWNSKVLSRP